jgi:hypothetical protein
VPGEEVDTPSKGETRVKNRPGPAGGGLEVDLTISRVALRRITVWKKIWSAGAVSLAGSNKNATSMPRASSVSACAIS